MDKQGQSKVLKGLRYQRKKFEHASSDSEKSLVDLQQDSDVIKVTFKISITVVCKMDQSGRKMN